MRDSDALLSRRALSIDVSGIRRVFELGAKLANPINLSIGQPDFAVPEPIKQAAIDAIAADRNGYTLTQGSADLLASVRTHLESDVGWSCTEDMSGELAAMISSGTSGALLLAFLALVNPGDEVILSDPYFVAYPAIASIAGASVAYCETYPDFRMTAERVEPLITDRTKLVLLNSPGNPSGVVLTDVEVRELAELCAARNVVLVSDEIYDTFTYPDAREGGKCPSPARHGTNMLLIRGFGKTYGCTGWRMGFAAGPAAIIREMAKLQQYTFVCAPSMAQTGLAGAFEVDMTPQVRAYQRRRDMVLDALRPSTEITHPGGAFYTFVRVPDRLGMSSTEFVERAVERNVLVIPGSAFSQRDTHFRLSYATAEDRLAEGLEILAEMLS